MHEFEASAADKRRVWILPSFPTPNGDLHVGHLSGPFVAADVLRRSASLQGQDPRLLLGTVGHQSQVATAAQAAGRSFYEEADANTAAIRRSLSALLIQETSYVEPRDGAYAQISNDVFERLASNGTILHQEVLSHHCRSCETDRFEAFLTGKCPHCSSAATAGIECENCALPYEESELVDAACAICGTATELVPILRWVMPLEPLRERLVAHHGGAESTPTLRRYLDRVLQETLPIFPVSIPGHNGIRVEVPRSARPSQVLYSGFELAGRYLTAIEQEGQKSGRSWLEELREHKDSDLVVLFGFDNAYLRGIVFAGMLLALDVEGLEPPSAYLSNEFYNLDGEKFSTSRRHAIWGSDVATSHDPELLRLYVSLTRPDVEPTNFVLDEFESFAEAFGTKLEVLINRIEEQSRWASNQQVSPTRAYAAEEAAKALELAESAVSRYSKPRTFDPRRLARAAVSVLDTVAELARFVAAGPGAVSNTEAAVFARGLTAMTPALTPFMPSLAGRLAQLSSLDGFSAAATGWEAAATSPCVYTSNFLVRHLDPEQDCEPLFAALDSDAVWEHIPSGRPATSDAYRARLSARKSDSSWMQLVVTDRQSGRVLGTTSFKRISPKSVEIGSTTLAPELWGTGANKEIKQGLLQFARKIIGVEEVLFQTDINNVRSQRALLKIGATHVETRIADVKRQDGSLRDSLVYRLRLDANSTGTTI